MRWIGLVFPVILSACVGTQPEPSVVDAPIGEVAEGETSPPPAPDPARLDPFPAGRGVTNTVDDLRNLTHQPMLLDPHAGYADRIAWVTAQLGVEGVPQKDAMFDGLSFVAIGPKGAGGPYSCEELILTHQAAFAWVRPVDNHRCGLPYMEDSTNPYRGPGPVLTVTTLRETLAKARGLAPLDAELVLRRWLAKPVAGVEPAEWIGIGPRSNKAPFTCHVLSLTPPLEVVEAPLDRCGLTWPLPAERFDPGPAIPAIDKASVLAECQSGCGQDMCVLTDTFPVESWMHNEPDGVRARYYDGRSAKLRITKRCLPIPASCTTVSIGCFPGVCAAPDYAGESFSGGPPHIECYVRPKPL